MPKVVDHDQRRVELAEVVWRVIATQGMQCVTIRQLSLESGWSRGVLAHYFTDKDGLLLFAFQLATDRAMARIEEQRKRNSGMNAVRAIALESLDLDEVRRMETRVWTSFIAHAASEPSLADEHRRRYKEWSHILEGALSEAVLTQELPQDTDVAAETESLIAFIDGLSIQAMFDPSHFAGLHLLDLLDTYLARLGRP